MGNCLGRGKKKDNSKHFESGGETTKLNIKSDVDVTMQSGAIVDTFASKRAEAEKPEVVDNSGPDDDQNRIVDVFAERKAAQRKQLEESGNLPFAENEKDATIIREPDSMGGSDFRIDNCHNCDFFILDTTIQILVDGCTNCRFVLAPCEGSLFFRNCTNCVFVTAVKQLRTRDCKDIDLFLYCNTRPTIETTTKLRLACLQMSYFPLKQQFEKANQSPWNNKWSDIYDFNPKDDEQHFEYLPEDVKWTDLIDLSKLTSKTSAISDDEFDALSLVPLSSGLRKKSGGSRLLLVTFGKVSTNSSWRKLMDIGDKESSWRTGEYTPTEMALVRSAQTTVSASQAKQLFKGDEGAINACKSKPDVVGFEFSVDDALRTAIQSVVFALGPKKLWLCPEDATAEGLDVFFTQLLPSDQI